jgi:hypothetical protein
MKKYLVGAATAAMMMAGSANAATIYDLNLVDSGANLGTGPFGTVTVTDQGGGVLDFLVQLAAGYEFRDAADGNHDGFVFETTPDGGVPIPVTNLASSLGTGAASGFVEIAPPPFQDNPFGVSWDHALECQACVPGWNPAVNATWLSFTTSGLAVAFNTVNPSNPSGGPYNVYFAADVVNSGGFTGAVGAQLASAVPESSTWTLLIAGFGLLGFALRRRPATQGDVAFA